MAGAALCVAAAWVVRGMAIAHGAVALALLGPSQNQLQARVEALQTSRDRAVDSAEAERRRIERDLHDGAQQRLVALAMDLGMARAKLETDPAAATALVGEAHEEAKRALAELRDLARGIHPAVLADRGLDAAISALAARSPVPVGIDVATGRLPGAGRVGRLLRGRRGPDQRGQARPGGRDQRAHHPPPATCSSSR